MNRAIGEKLAIELLPEPKVTPKGIHVVDTSGPGQRALARGVVKSIGKDVNRDVKVGDVVLYREFMSFKADGLDFVWQKDVIAVEG